MSGSTTTSHAQVLSTVVAALRAAPALATCKVASNRTRPVSEKDNTAIVVRLLRSQGNKPTVHFVDWTTTLAIECMARSATGTDPATAADTLILAAWAQLAAISPAAVGWMDSGLQPDIAWDYDEQAQPQCSATILLNVQHRTPANSLTPTP